MASFLAKIWPFTFIDRRWCSARFGGGRWGRRIRRRQRVARRAPPPSPTRSVDCIRRIGGAEEVTLPLFVRRGDAIDDGSTWGRFRCCVGSDGLRSSTSSYTPSTTSIHRRRRRFYYATINHGWETIYSCRAPGGNLLLQSKNDDDELLTKFLLVYSCEAFEGGRVYEILSRFNHLCNPNAVVVEGQGGGGGGIAGEGSLSDGTNESDALVLKAACDIASGDEICIS